MAEEFNHDLPDGMTAWIAEVGGGRITRLERHIARREAWVVDVTRPDDSVAEYFLRLDREGDGSGTHSVKHEAKVQAALAESGLKVPAIHAWNDNLQAALHERVPGRADLDNADPGEQATVFEDFVQQLALLHSLDPDSLGLDHMVIPTTSAECALGEIEFVEQFLAGMVVDPLYTFSLQWLKNHVPEPLDRVCLLQGDTGPANFMFDQGRVSAIVDWEWAHFGDPMEDLGNICAREFYCPSTPEDGLGPVFRRYEELSGFPVHLDSVRYYRVQQFVRSIVSLARITEINDPQMPNAMNRAYRYICERATCEALADAMGVELERPELPEVEMAPSLEGVIAANLRDEVRPAVAGDFARHRLEHAGLLVECLDRRARMGPQLALIELDEIAAFTGKRAGTLEDGLMDLDRTVKAGGADREEEMLRYLARRAWRLEHLWKPVVDLFPGRTFSRID
ncbi:phosphotransferase family protein [Candidatus Poriferisocius sp.]|uniref:phosphotransferase family protein n=1 Tax=Candidatus Poriferisocius sp. TaxID=3101276 RepID=UPI003B02D0E7